MEEEICLLCTTCSANRAMKIAEKKFKSHDLNGAIEFAHVAKALFPVLDGIDNFLAAYEVHAAAATKKINGRTDWHAILSLDHSAQYETIKMQYKRKSLLVHPDKNRSAAADGAFKLVSEAWNALSKMAGQKRGRGNDMAAERRVQFQEGRDNDKKYDKRYQSALWAKKISEKKFKYFDLLGAMESAHLAKDLYPGLDGIDQIIAAYKIYMTAIFTKKINRRIDWYAVLGVDYSADLKTIKNQYKRKVHSVHPEKNGSAAVALAFMLVTEAWNVLSKPDV